MLTATTPPQRDLPIGATSPAPGDTVETLLWVEEHDWLYALLKSDQNVAPRFRMPDLISACVSQLFTKDDASERLFSYLGGELILRSPSTPRRRESLWRPQYQTLRSLQVSPANRYPHPQFQLDQLTTACVALARVDDGTGACTLRHARINIARRSAIGKVILPT